MTEIVLYSGDGCAHLLAHDFEHDSFSLIMDRDENGQVSYLLKTMSELLEMQTLSITYDLKVNFSFFYFIT